MSYQPNPVQVTTSLGTQVRNDLKIDPSAHWVGMSRMIKKGFCGTSAINYQLDLYLDNDMLVMKRLNQQNNQDESLPGTFTGRYKDLMCAETEAVMKMQKTTEGKSRLGKHQENLVVPPPGGPYKWMIGFESSNKKAGYSERSYFFFKDDQELEKFKNTILGNTAFGKGFLQSSSPSEGSPNLLSHIIQQKKAAIGEMLLNSLERLNKQREENNSGARIIDKPSLNTRPAEPQKSTFMNAKPIYQVEANLRSLPKKIEIVRRQHRDSTNNQFILTPRKYYNLTFMGGQLVDNNAHTFFELHLVVSPKPFSDDELARGSISDNPSVWLETIPLPITASSSMTTEYSIICSRGSLDLTSFFGSYLTLYTRSTGEPGILGVGHKKIEKSEDAVLVVDIFKSKGGLEKDSDKKLIGSVVFKIEHPKTPAPNHPAFYKLTDPKSFGEMKRLQTSMSKDYGLNNLEEDEGVARKFYKIRQNLAAEYNFQIQTVSYESNRYRLNQWLNYEAQVDTAIKHTANRIAANGTEIIVGNSQDYVSIMSTLFKIQPWPQHIERGSKSFIFFSRDHWRDAKEFLNLKELTEKAQITGMPDYLYLPVWKSLGKVPLVSEIVFQICKAKFANFNHSASLLDQLGEAGKDELYHNPSIEKDLAAMDQEYFFPQGHHALIKKVICAFLHLSLLMEAVSEDTKLTGPILKGFSLKSVGGIVHIVRHLVGLRSASIVNAVKDERCRTVTEDDVFLVLLSISFFFMPEHFLNPLFNFEPDESCKIFYHNLKSFGVDYEKLQKQKLFITSSAVGSYKLSLILSDCIKKEARDIFDKMTEVGFPFLTFCLDLSESLFSEFLNQDTLSRLWNTLFFEGADKIKRRAQQIILSALIVIIKNCRKEILESSSSYQILWHLKARGEFSFESTQFMCDIFNTRNIYFVTKPQEGSIFTSAFTSAFVRPDLSVENDLKEIKEEINKDFQKIGYDNSKFLDFIVRQVKSIEASKKRVDIDNLNSFLEGLNVIVDPNSKVDRLIFEDKTTRASCQLTEKPRVSQVGFAISSYDTGNLSADSVVVTFKTNFSMQGYEMRPLDVCLVYHRPHGISPIVLTLALF